MNNTITHEFRFKPYLRGWAMVERRDDLLKLQDYIEEALKEFPNFLGVDFCDVGARGIQIRGHHADIKNYTYGDQPTIKYDFSNMYDAADEFIKMWKQIDNPESVRKQLDFIAMGEKYGWD